MFGKKWRTGVWIIRSWATILSALCEKKAVLCPDKFEKYCDDHLEKFEQSPHSWNKHTPTVCYLHIQYSNIR